VRNGMDSAAMMYKPAEGVSFSVYSITSPFDHALCLTLDT
jgi:hypothetical protein